MNTKNIYPRIYCNQELKINKCLHLSCQNSYYIIHVLRMNLHSMIEIFNNTNYIFYAYILIIKKDNVIVKIFKNKILDRESPLNIHLGQAITKKEKIEFTIQKSVELGVKSITPILTNKCKIKIGKNKVDKKISRWEKIIISTCQQCTRNIIPLVNIPITLIEWLKKSKNSKNIICHPSAKLKIDDIIIKKNDIINLLIGPESGFSNDEIKISQHYGFIPISLGKRILRTETAAIVALSILQFKFGDLS